MHSNYIEYFFERRLKISNIVWISYVNFVLQTLYTNNDSIRRFEHLLLLEEEQGIPISNTILVALTLERF